MSLTKDYPNANWATATEITVVPRITYPFKKWGDTSGYIVERDYVQAEASYDPTAVALDTADATYTSAFLIEESRPFNAGPSLVQFTRKYATVPSTMTSYRWEVVTFLGYYVNLAEGSSSYRPQLVRLSPITETRTFIKNAAGSFAITGTPYEVEKTGSDATLVQYVNASTSPTITTYQSLVSGSTAIQFEPNSIERAYGAGNIWMQTQSKTVAQ